MKVVFFEIAMRPNGSEPNMKSSRIKTGLLALAVGGIPLITSATCDPVTGIGSFFRDDDGGGFYDPYYYSGDVFVDYYDPYYDPVICDEFGCY